MAGLIDISLKTLLNGISGLTVTGDVNAHIAGLAIDSRKVGENFLFAAFEGAVSDGHDFINTAIEKGATVILSRRPQEPKEGVTYIQSDNPRDVLGAISAIFYQHPSRELKIIGITGTNGKTTVSTLLYKLLKNLGYEVGLLSTVANRIGSKILPATHTTPDIISLYELLNQMIEAGCEYAIMEVSSHAIDQARIGGLEFTGGVFTNITHDHLDYHKTMEEYIRVKKLFFDNLPATAFALSNIDDKRGEVMLQNTKARKLTYSLRGIGDYSTRILEMEFAGMLVSMNGIEIHSPLVGTYNAYNLTACFAVADQLGFEQIEILQGLSVMYGVDGRFETLKEGKDSAVGIIDYAHTPDALKNVLHAIRELKTGNETLITVVGCGGDRDSSKRSLMGKVAAELSDKVIFTSDNPRSEDPEEILKDVLEGVSPARSGKVLKITDRKEAIRTACALAGAFDIILVAGKGHEKYQEIKGERFPFDDKEILKQELREKFKSN